MVISPGSYQPATPAALHVRLYRQLLSAADDGERERVIQALLHSPVAPESLYIDCKEIKSDPSKLTKEEKGAFAKAVSGFANGSGGVVLWGVEWKDLGRREDPGKPRVWGVRRCQELKALFDSSGKDATDRPASVENIAIPIQGCEDPEADGIVVSFVPESESAPHRARWGPSDVMNHYFRRYSDSFRVLTHAELEDMFGVRQRPALTPQIALFRPEKNQTKCVWDVWNFGRAVATAVTLEIRARISGSAQQGSSPLSIENWTPGHGVAVERINEVEYALLDCYLLPTAMPIRSLDGHVKVIEFWFPLPKINMFCEQELGLKSPVLRFGQLRFDWVIGAHSMRPRRGSFTIPLSSHGFTTIFDGFVYQSLKRWWGRDGEETDISLTEAGHP